MYKIIQKTYKYRNYLRFEAILLCSHKYRQLKTPKQTLSVIAPTTKTVCVCVNRLNIVVIVNLISTYALMCIFWWPLVIWIDLSPRSTH